MKAKIPPSVTKLILRSLDRMARVHGLEATRHAVNKWAGAQRTKNRLAKERKRLRRELAQVNRGLRS